MTNALAPKSRKAARAAARRPIPRRPARRAPLLECVVVTGLSGAGKSMALRALEDLGYFCVDNFPLELLSALMGYYRHMGQRLSRVAVGVDVRTGTVNFTESIQRLRRHGVRPRILFLDCGNDTLIRRFSETRRRHPLSGSVPSGIRKERRRLKEIKALADKILDTSRLTPTEMKEMVARTLGLRHPRGMAVMVTSFGYKHGLPLDADMVWDARFLPNPNYVPRLHALTGEHPAVSRYVLGNPLARRFMAYLGDTMDFLAQQFAR
ncbi:MAG: RNase adapter RapZ, partial [Elusimicrobiota bacterium]